MDRTIKPLSLLRPCLVNVATLVEQAKGKLQAELARAEQGTQTYILPEEPHIAPGGYPEQGL